MVGTEEGWVGLGWIGLGWVGWAGSKRKGG